MYKTQRNYENLQKWIFDGTGEFDIPQLHTTWDVEVDNWISFNFAMSCEEPENHGVHFFLDDYQFIRLWSNPDAYLERLKKFQAVCTPDFSMFTDWPKAVCLYNHYRKHWLGAYWQQYGITVIPTIGWVDEESFDWCFDGEPVGGVVAVSSVGTQMNKDAARLFRRGYDEMMDRLNPSKIIFYGSVPEGCEGNIIPVKPFFSRLRSLEGRTVKNI